MLPGKKYTPEEALRIAWRRKWLIILPFVTVAAATAIVAWRLPERYRSDTLILVMAQRVPEAYVKSTVTTPGQRDVSDRLEAVKQQVLSRTRLERLILDLDLYQPQRRNGIMEDVVEGMRRDVEVQMVPKGDAFRLAFTYGDRRLAMEVVNKLAAAFIDESNQDRTTFAETTTNFLETQLEEAKRRLEELEKRRAEYRMQHAGELPTERDANLQMLASTQAQIQALSESVNRDRDRRYLLERTLAELSAEAPAVVSGPVNTDTNVLSGATAGEQLEAARGALRALELRFKPDHPDVRRAKRIIADLEVKAQQEALQRPVSPDGTGPRPANAQDAARLARMRDLRLEMEGIDRVIATKQAEQRALQARVGEYQRRVEATPARESELTSLTRDWETVQKHYSDLLAKQEDSKIAANLERRQIGEQFRTVDQARLPERPVSPNRPMINLFGALCGLGLGVGIVALLEYRDNSFRADEEVVRVLSLPVVAVIPVMLSRTERRAARRRSMIVAAASVGAAVVAVGVAVWFFVMRG